MASQITIVQCVGMNESAERLNVQNGRLDIEAAVSQRYSAASQEAESALCCSVDYDSDYLRVLPAEIVERDYGCGNPSRFVKPGQTVLDLGCGAGKICYIASQIVGPQGRVLGVDMNDDMLALARSYQRQVGDRIGWHNVQFFKARIQDLALDIDLLEQYLAAHPVANAKDWTAAQQYADNLRCERAMIADDSIDTVLSNCVLNLVRPADRQQLFREIHRVLRPSGCAVISDIVSDEPVPDDLQRDPVLWSGCISGAFEEFAFLDAFEQAGFYGVEILSRQDEPWTTVEGIEFRSVTVRAFKPQEGPRLDYHQAVIYNGPWRSVTDDEGNVLRRGVRTAVCGKSYQMYSRAPYAACLTPVSPYTEVSDAQARSFDSKGSPIRSPRVTKGVGYRTTQLPTAPCCGTNECQ
jgi:ubiquinone/menaquinone biosynthesis C-methylase UbiE